MRYEPHTVSVPLPAAGANAVYVTGGDGLELLTVVRAQLVASAVVKNRRLLLSVLNPGGAVIMEMVADNASLVAGATLRATWGYGLATGVQVLASGPRTASPSLPYLLLQPGSQVQVVIDNADAGDQLSGVTVTVLRECPDEGEPDALHEPLRVGLAMPGGVV